MLQIYARKADRFCLREISNPAIEQAISPALWYDLLSPTNEEVKDVEAALRISMPTRLRKAGTVRAKAAFDNADGRLFANQCVNVRLQIRLIEQALTVPATAVQNNHVYLLQADGQVTQRRLELGVTDGDRVSVTGDLQPGDRVVTDGLDRLREGSKVTVIDPGQAQAPAADRPRADKGRAR